MSGHYLHIALLSLMALNLRAQAAAELFDLIPEGAPAALVVRNVEELRKKGDQLVAEAGLGRRGRPSELFEFLIKDFHLQGKIETDGPIGFVIVNPAVLGIEVWDE